MLVRCNKNDEIREPKLIVWTEVNINFWCLVFYRLIHQNLVNKITSNSLPPKPKTIKNFKPKIKFQKHYKTKRQIGRRSSTEARRASIDDQRARSTSNDPGPTSRRQRVSSRSSSRSSPHRALNRRSRTHTRTQHTHNPRVSYTPTLVPPPRNAVANTSPNFDSISPMTFDKGFLNHCL